MGALASWSIVKSAAVPPLSYTVDSAYQVQVACGELRRNVVVEFTAPSSLTSVGYAEEVTRPYLANTEPPRRLAVDVGGEVHVVLGPVDATTQDEAPPLREAGRARSRRR